MGELIHSTVYTQEQVRRGLLTLAAHGGNSHTASEACGIPDSTLQDWRNRRYPELYRELHDTHGREIEQALIPELRETAILAAQASQQAVKEAQRQLANGDVKDPAGAARNLATTSAVAMDKLYLATDRPTEIRTNLTPAAVLQRLTEALNTVNSDAIEEPTDAPAPLPPTFSGLGHASNAQE